MVEIEKGILIIGFSNTVLFGGEPTVELLLLDVATKKDFSLPLAPEQAEYLFEQVSLADMLDLPEEEATAEGDASEETSTNRERLDGILKGENRDAQKPEGVWSEAEATSQF